MHTAPVLHWELYGAGTEVTFRATREDDCYALTLYRDDDLVMSAVAPDREALFSKSAGLRGALQELGYAPAAGGAPVVHLGGGVCWGPAPLDVAVLRSLR